MEITSEKIELVKDRTGVTEEEAREALENSDGNVVDAIIAIEENYDSKSAKTAGAKKEMLIDKMKEIVKKGNISKIMISRNGEKILNIPLTVGILGTVIAPWGVIAGTVAAMGFKCDIIFVDTNGKEFSLSEKAGDFYFDAKDKGEVLKSKAPEVYKEIKEKGEDVVGKAKETAENIKERVTRENVSQDINIETWQDVPEEDIVEVTEEQHEDATVEQPEEEQKEENADI